MPYCPKCDMEFVEGITVCSDCGGPLLNSKEEADEMLLEAKKLEEEKRLAEFERMRTEYTEADGPAEESIEKTVKARTESSAYLSKRQRCDDMNSSVSAFAMVGALLTVFGLLCFAKIVKLPLAAGSMMLFQSVLTLMGIGSLIIAAVTRKSARAMAAAADTEDARTRELTEWFAETYTASGLDAELLKEDASLEENELYIKRFELIQDHLVTSHDLPDQNYVDFLCEEIYAQIFEQ